ncbi:MAG: TonB-dependent receptor plug domain-containing protein, partial [Flavobacteriales bacterium]|nr:TonB-dependent receptor plug domain-containing protein [Flavobacteriales bacterium]
MNRSLTKRIAWKAIFLAFMMLGIFSGNSLHADNIVIGSYVQQQSITVQQELTIKELFKLIEKQTDFDFFYSSSLNELDNKVDLNLVNTTVDVVLETAFTNSELEFTIKDKDVMIRKNPNASDQQEEKTVTGVVKDERGDTLPGASVVVKGSTTGTSTDFDGNFSIDVTEGQTLVFSFMGYTDAEIVIGASNTYNVNMQPSSNVLDEIIVSGVASGTSKKKMSVSVTKVKADAINQVPQSSVSSSLQGKVAGVTVTSSNGSPGSGSGIQLRGATSLSGGSNPMILLDGVIMQGSLADINVDDVETMEVVKGAAASALYGSRAANGVVVITTRRGSSLKEGQTTVTFRNEVGVQQVAKYLDLAKSHVYDLDPTWLDVDTYTKFKYVNYPADYVGGWEPAITGSRRKKEDGYMDMPYRVNNDLQSSMFTNGLSYTNYIGVGHRVNHTNLFISFENNADQGVVVETGGYKRQSFRVNIDHAISENVKISASNNYIITSNDKIPGGTSAFFNVLMMEPDVDLFAKNENGQ